jgi:uncharacterized protein YoxC
MVSMTELITRSGAWLAQQAAALPDTLVMKTVAAERGWFETVTGIASGIMSITLVALTIVLAPAAWSFWKTFRKARALLDRVYGDINPLTQHANSVADNLDYITTSIRNDVQQVNATIASANRRLHQAVAQTETRLNEFNALLQVAQQEAEQAFVSTAAVVRGVRTGAATLSGAHERIDDDGFGGNGDGDDDEPHEDTLDESERRAPPRRPATRPKPQTRRGRRE